MRLINGMSVCGFYGMDSSDGCMTSNAQAVGYCSLMEDRASLVWKIAIFHQDPFEERSSTVRKTELHRSLHISLSEIIPEIAFILCNSKWGLTGSQPKGISLISGFPIFFPFTT